MSAAYDGTLDVPGARLFYKVRGTGPVLLILQGGGGDADGSDALVRHLPDVYKVVTYDRRGLSRSILDDPAAPISIEVHSDDAYRLLTALSPEPAFVLGISVGALIALDLVIRHPEQVRLLIAYEPGIADLLPDDEREKAKQTHLEVDQLYRRVGPPAAMKKMAALSRLNLEDREPDVDLALPDAQRAALHSRNVNFFLAHDAPAAHSNKLDLAALQNVRSKILPAAGRNSGNSMPHQTVKALADRLNSKIAYFTGGHTAYVLRPRDFAATLRMTLPTIEVSSSR
jgi:pimeloyl-ACP methyl ester carboxylesterase